MKNFVLLCLLVFSAISAEPAFAHSSGTATFWGTTVGATFGGIVGSTIGKGAGRAASTAAGVLVGGLTGNAIGQSIDSTSSYTSSVTTQYYSPYAPSFRPYRPRYVAPPSSVIVVRPQIMTSEMPVQNVVRTGGYLSSEPRPQQKRNRHCREFTQTVKIDGQTHESYGTACLRPDGTWEIQK